jgi:hypothetical protein
MAARRPFAEREQFVKIIARILHVSKAGIHVSLRVEACGTGVISSITMLVSAILEIAAGSGGREWQH